MKKEETFVTFSSNFISQPEADLLKAEGSKPYNLYGAAEEEAKRRGWRHGQAHISGR